MPLFSSRRPSRVRSKKRRGTLREQRFRTVRLEALEERTPLATFVVSDTNHVALRVAIQQANDNPGLDTIQFNIPGGGVQTIQPTFPLPDITDPVIIDGTTQPGYSQNAPKIQIDGSRADEGLSSGLAIGLNFKCGGNTVQGLIINNFSGSGIRITELASNPLGHSTIRFNFVGTDPTGKIAKPNRIGVHLGGTPMDFGGLVGSPNNTITQNLISGNTDDGVEIDFASSTGNRLEGNLIGTDITGMNPLGNGLNGVSFVAPNVPFLREGNEDPRGYASNNIIDGTVLTNVISGNKQSGVYIFRGFNNTVRGNFIGVGADGKTPVPNGTNDATASFGNDGIWIEEGTGNFIGSPAADRGNLISANKGHGIRISAARKSANDNTIQFNLIGTDVDGNFKAGLGNGLSGIEIRNESVDAATNVEVSRNVIGGADEDDGFTDGVNLAGNTIGGNQGDGIHIVGHRMGLNRIEGNNIGVNLAGTAKAANGGDGIILNSFNNQTPGDSLTIIGGTRALEGNLISGNVGNGIVIGRGTRANVAQNIIGLDKTAQNKLGNGFDGIFIGLSSNNIIGGVANSTGGIDVSGNTIGGNVGNGVTIFDNSSGNTLLDNLIGQNGDGKPLGNGQNGVTIEESPNTTIGGLKPVEGNLIAYNANAGVRIHGANSNGTKIIGNTINNNFSFAVNVQQTANTQVKSNIIFANAAGLGFANCTSVVVTSNIIGTDKTDTPDIGNLGPGVIVENSPGAVIGADTFEAGGNVISGHEGTSLFGAGIIVRGSQSTDVKILGNRIGTDFAGVNPLGNEDGIVILDNGQGTPSKAIVRGNVISGNRVSGVTIAEGAFGNTVADNYIGTNATVAELGNVTGVLIQDAPNNTIGGSDVASANRIVFNHDGVIILNSKATGNTVANNVITANTVFGVLVQFTSGATISDNRISANARGIGILKSAGTNILGNFIGTNSVGDAPQANTEVGIIVESSPDTVIGADSFAGGGNLISGNGGAGIELRGGQSTGAVIIGNRIGSDVSGQKPLGNRHGILLIASPGFGGAPSGATISNNLIAANERNGITISDGASNNTIGGATAAAGNQIQQNGLAGVAVESTAGTGNAILSNITLANGGLGIDLGATGVTANDGRKDPDIGPNKLQNFPELTLATRGGTHRVAGTLQSTANATFTVQIFETDSKDPSGHGEGEHLIATTTVQTNASGIGFFDVEVAELDPDTSVTATATDAINNSSEFAKCITAGTDTDEDGISDVMEDTAANGGDGNQDGTPDRAQRSVASFPSAGNGAPVTLTIETPGAIFENVRPLINPSPDDAPAGAFFGLSFFNFTIFGIEPGQDVLVNLTLPAGMNPKSYFRYGPLPGQPAPQWYNWVFDVDGKTGAEISGNRVKLHFIDGDRGDDDLEANGSIVDPGGPGYDPALLVTNTNDSGAGSLRQAILDANARTGFDFINFEIGTGGPATIAPASNLPTITGPVFIDGASQPGFNGTPLIELNGEAISGLSGGQVIFFGTGLTVSAFDTTIRNLVINRFGTAGINLFVSNNSMNNVVIEGNFIGTDITGMLSRPNGNGIVVSSGAFHRIGGVTTEKRNVISGNSLDGISLSGGFGVQIQGNFIGLAADGVSPLGNADNGVRASSNAFNLTIGGLAAGAGNVIAFNQENGVASLAVNRNTAILSNSIHSNGLLGIARDAGGKVVLNDIGTSDTIGTNVQNFPVLSSAQSSGGQTTVSGYLNSRPNQTFTLQFFGNTDVEPTGFGEGRTLLGASTVTTNASGHADFTASLPVPLINGQLISATATNSINNNTSEFSRRLAVGEALTNIIVVNSADDVDDGVADATHTSLREALHAANNFPGPNEIRFAIGSGVQTIMPLSPLPAIVESVSIDGTTQPGFTDSPIIELNGASRVTQGFVGYPTTEFNDSSGLAVNASNTTIRGLVINRFAVFVLATLKTNPPSQLLVQQPYAAPGIDIYSIGAESSFGGVVIEGNYIGTDVAGMLPEPNSGGIHIRGGNNHRVGGTTSAQRNIISGNLGNGIDIHTGDGHLIQGNFIGVGADGVAPLGNTTPDLVVDSRIVAYSSWGNGIAINTAGTGNVTRSTIGGLQAGAGNLIAFNGRDGITTRLPFAGNPILSNSIHSNRLLGLSYFLSHQVLLNEQTLLFDSAGRIVKYPVIHSAESTGGQTTISGHFDGAVNANFVIQFFSSAIADASGFGEGEVFLGSTNITTDASGHVDFTATLPVAVANRRLITATATDAAGSTSQFSRRQAVGEAHPGVLIVNATDDVDDGTADATHTSLREAIHAANNNPGLDEIRFAIGSGVQTISPFTPLPAIVDSTVIDGWTQPGFTGTPIIELSGALLDREQFDRPSATSFYMHGIGVLANNSTVRGLVINRFLEFTNNLPIIGLRVGGQPLTVTGNGNVVEGVYVGTNVAGTSALGNFERVRITGNNNRLGGTAAQQRNLFAAGREGGIGVSGDNNVFQGNFVGTNAAGNAAIPNSSSTAGRAAVDIIGANNLIGGGGPEVGNLISGNNLDALAVSGPGNIIQGNFIGTNAAGTARLSNSGNGLYIAQSPFLAPLPIIVGGTQPAERNIISGNFIGILVNGSDGVIQGNFIGNDISGTIDLGNTMDGIFLNSGDGLLIGGTASGAGNLISGNDRFGILIARSESTGHRIQGNRIGTKVDGVSALGNGSDGIAFGTDFFAGTNGTGPVDSLIGGTEVGAGNIIAFNGRHGVNIAAGKRIGILSNSIFSNGQLGIDLNGDGATANDSSDTDTGDNNLQNFPLLSDAATDGLKTTASGTLNSSPNAAFLLQFFASPAADPSGFGEGQTFLGSHYVVTDASGNSAFTFVFPASVPIGQRITATATDLLNNTSEFSLNLAVTDGTIPANQPPVANAGGPYAVNEGDPLSFFSPSDDPDGDPITLSWDINGDGIFGDAVGGKLMLTWAQLQALGIINGPSSFDVRVRVDGGVGQVVTSSPTKLNVSNVKPVASAGPTTRSVVEGSQIEFTGTFTDPGTADTHTFNWHVSASNGQVIADGSDASFSFIPLDNGVYTVTFTVTDSDEESGTVVVSVNVLNADPIAQMLGLPARGTVGVPIHLTSLVSDPSQVDVTAGLSLSWFADLTPDYEVEFSATTPDFTFTPTEAGIWDVALIVRDKDFGRGVAQAFLEVVPAASPPIVALGTDASVDEGSEYKSSGSFSDPNSEDTWSATVNYGDGSGDQPLTLKADKTFDLSHAYADNGTFDVVVTVTDNSAHLGTQTTHVTVKNVAPAAEAGDTQTVNEGDTVELHGSFTDPGADDTHTFKWQVQASNGQVIADGDQQNFQFVPDGGGIYTITFIVTDDDAGVGSDSFIIEVTAEPNQAPVITSNGGGSTAAVSIQENSTAVTTVVATDPDTGTALTYTIIGGADAAEFTIDPATHALRFIIAPDYEAPTDTGADNVYHVIVQVSDGSLTDTQAITIDVTNVYPWHNLTTPLDVRGGTSIQPDNSVDAGDALAIINYINAFDSGEVPEDALLGQPFGFLDTTKDNFVAPDDALTVINAINSGLGGEQESTLTQDGSSSFAIPGGQPISPSSEISTDELIGLLAMDLVLQSKRRR